ncbi:hypothetical protein D3C78_649880 [compost metagenome]
MLQFFLGVLQGASHAIDAGGQFVQLLAAEGRQAGFQMAVLELGYGLLDLAQWPVDRTTHAQGQQCRTDQSGCDQHQAGEQAAVTAQQHTVMGQLQFDPAQQAVGFLGNHVSGQVAVFAEHRQKIAGRIVATAAQHLHAAAGRRLVEHGRAGVGQQRAVGRQEGHGPYVSLFQGLGGDAFEQFVVLMAHGWRRQGSQLLGDHFAALHELGLQVSLLHPGKIPPQHQRHQAGWQQGQQQHAAFDSQFLEHASLLHPAVHRPAHISVVQHLRSVAICSRAIFVKMRLPFVGPRRSLAIQPSGGLPLARQS